jgi:putative DNA primase/helicase
MDNYASVVHQMEAFGVEFTSRDLPLVIPTPKRRTFGKKGKYWYWLQLFRPRAGGEYIVGKFGTYKHGGSECKVEIDWKPLSEAERERYRAERQAAGDLAKKARHEAAAIAAIGAAEVWSRASREGSSPYLQKKGVEPESCRFVTETVHLARRDPEKRPFVLPPGTLVLPLLRYDATREAALRGLQFVKPDGFKIYTEDLAKTGCALRLGQVDASTRVVLVCEGYATGLSIRMATGRRWPVYVAWDAYNLVSVVEILRQLHPEVHLLVCADDDWRTADHDGRNPGQHKAKLAAKKTTRCDFTWPVFDAERRQETDTDFNDLHVRQGLEEVTRQLMMVLAAIARGVHL